MSLSEVDLLEFAERHQELLAAIKKIVGLPNREDPLNVPLEALDWRQGKIQLYAADQPTVEFEEDIFVVKLPTSAIGIDSSGRRFLAYKGDYLVRNQDGAYSLIKRGVQHG